MIHDGPDTDNPLLPGNNIGTAGCIEIYGAQEFSRFNNIILDLSGTNKLSEVNATVHYEKASRPNLLDFGIRNSDGSVTDRHLRN